MNSVSFTAFRCFAKVLKNFGKAFWMVLRKNTREQSFMVYISKKTLLLPLFFLPLHLGYEMK